MLDAWTAVGAALICLGAVITVVGWRGRVMRGERRCPRCGHDLRGTSSLRCTECGRTAASERQLVARRRRSAVVMGGVILCLVGVLSARGRDVRAHGWLSLVPTPVLIALLPPPDQMPRD